VQRIDPEAQLGRARSNHRNYVQTTNVACTTRLCPSRSTTHALRSSTSRINRLNLLDMWLRRSCLPALARSFLQRSAPALARAFATDYSAVTAENIRNVAIVAHVDHGKTTLVDQLLKHGGNTLSEERIMDSIDLERERGITIMSKCTRVEYNGHVLNIVDTPGHADFGGEVERILSMVDGVVLVVDATEGPMSQTKFVLTKALHRGLKPLVVINKVDRDTSRLDGSVENELFDMFVALDATDDQLEFPVLYASAKQGWAVHDLDDASQTRDSMLPLLDEITRYVPAPETNADKPFAMAVTMIGHDPYVGRLATGRVHAGTVKVRNLLCWQWIFGTHRPCSNLLCVE